MGGAGVAVQGSFELLFHLRHVVIHGGVMQHGIGREMPRVHRDKGTSEQQYRCENGHAAIQLDK